MLVQNTIYKIIYKLLFFKLYYFTTFYGIYVCPTLQRLSVTLIVFM